MDSLGEDARDVAPGGDGGERRPVADSLGHRDDVGHHPEVLKSPVVITGAAEASLHLIGDAESAVLPDHRVRFLQIIRSSVGGSPTPWIGSAMKPATRPGVEYRISCRMSSAACDATCSGVPENGLR